MTGVLPVEIFLFGEAVECWSKSVRMTEREL
jgi:hypothetical protein